MSRPDNYISDYEHGRLDERISTLKGEIEGALLSRFMWCVPGVGTLAAFTYATWGTFWSVSLAVALELFLILGYSRVISLMRVQLIELEHRLPRQSPSAGGPGWTGASNPGAQPGPAGISQKPAAAGCGDIPPPQAKGERRAPIFLGYAAILLILLVALHFVLFSISVTGAVSRSIIPLALGILPFWYLNRGREFNSSLLIMGMLFGYFLSLGFVFAEYVGEHPDILPR
jgi:hypothetical protein